MSDNSVVDFSIEFAVKIVKLTDEIQGKGVLKNQILKSGTSIGANIHEANYASSRADFIANIVIGDSRAAPSLRALTPSLLFMGVSSCFKGYFIARKNAAPSSSSQIFEQLARIVLIFIYFFSF